MSVLLLKTLRSSTFKWALIAIVVFGAVVVGLFSYVYDAATSFILGGSDRMIEAEYGLLRGAYDHGGSGALINAIERRLSGRPSAQAFYFLLTDESYANVVGNLAAWPTALKDANKRDETNVVVIKPESTDKQFLLRARAETLPGGFHLLIGRDISDLASFTWKINTALLTTIALIFILAVVASIAVTRRTVGRIEAINTTSRSIMNSGLGQRMPLRGTHDEWDHLAQNLNSMLERIESLMGEVKQVTDNVAHDLRTPLTRMRGRLEKASISDRQPDLDRSLINETIADLDDVLRIFSSLLRISQIEATNRKAAFRIVNLSDVTTQVAELFDAAAEDRAITLEVVSREPVFVNADRDLLFEALANLVDNAIKHGRQSGHVTIGIEKNTADALVFVADDGPGIPAEERQHVFRRFYRLEQSRGTPGNGLGLSLVAAVARLHGADIAMVENEPGLRVELRFSLACEAAPNASARESSALAP